MQQLSQTEESLIEGVNQQRMLERTMDWAKVNSGTGNLDGLAQVADMLSEAFSTLPGEVSLRDPAPVTVVSAEGKEVEKPHGRHLVCSVRPEAEKRFLLTGHMDTVFPVDHAFQDLTWLDDDTLNGPGTADMKAGLAIIP